MSVSRTQNCRSQRRFLEDLVADRMTERVIDRLEAVEIEHQQGERLAAALRAIERLLHALAEQRAVGKAGQFVMRRHFGDARLGALALGDVGEGAHHAAVGRGHRADFKHDAVRARAFVNAGCC